MRFIFTLLIALWILPAQAQPVVTDQVTAELIAEPSHIQPGETFWVGVHFDIIPHWHLYWINPGDSGLPPEIDWKLPDGFTVGDIQWPAPKYLDVGGLASFAYEDQLLLMVPITAPDSLPPGESATLTADLQWLVCEQACLPGGGTVSLTLPVKSETPAPGKNAPKFSNARKLLPLDLPSHGITASRAGADVILNIPMSALKDPSAELRFFPFSEQEFEHTAPQTMKLDGDTVTLHLSTSADIENVRGVLVTESEWAGHPGRSSWELDLPFSVASAVSESPSNIGLILFWGFIGGLILNLMPCVFPVLGLKIMGFVEQAGASRAKVTAHGLWFTAGVLVSFWILAGILIAIRSAGHELGWGFQLQSPLFVYGLALFLFLFALNLSGVFEIGTTLTQLGNQAEKHDGYLGTFMSGVLATLVATPCAAPFLAGALGTALTLPAGQSMTVFTFIALGLATPYLVLSMFPSLVGKLPRPGAWMETFKQAMSFLLYATVAYLIWIVLGQVDPDKSLSMLFGLVLVAVAAWVYGRFTGFTASTRRRWVARFASVALILGSAQLGWSAVQPTEIEWEKWSPERVAELREEGRTIYVDFTARWCVTCKANKLAVFSSDEVIRTFKKQNIATLKADWTNQDPEITRALAAFNRSAVPFNLIYSPDQDEPTILPELLTPGIVLDAIQ